VLGYYVVAQPYKIETPKTVTVENEDGTTSEVTTIETTTVMSIKEYLRPIVYDFDEATTLIDTEGEKIKVELNTVNGTTTPEEFLRRLSRNDGYKGSIDPSRDHAFGNYYKVEIEDEESGYGVYAYLCNYSEIQKATEYDTELGELAYNYANGHTLTDDQLKKLHHDVTLTLSAQKDDDTVVSVNTLGSLQQAIDKGVSNVVQLSSNITIGEGQTIAIPENARVMLDLNGHKIINLDGAAFTAASGSSLTLVNGSLEQQDPDGVTDPPASYVLRATGAEVLMSQITTTNFQYGIYIGDSTTGNELDSRVYLKKCNINGEVCAAFISGNGLVSEQKSRLIIEGSTLESPNIVIAGNGTTTGNGRWGTDIQIVGNSRINGTSSNSVGIYQPQKNSTLTVIDSRICASTGIALKGGSAEIMNSLIEADGAYNEPSFDGSGFTNTGDAIYIESNYEYDIYLKISKHSILQHAAEQSKSLRVYEKDAPNVVVEIESGTFDEELPPEYLVKGVVQSTDANGKTIVVVQENLGEVTEEQTDETTEPE
jgi:hypothetical protein